MDNKIYRLVNWKENMDVNCSHLEQLENYFIDRLCDTKAVMMNGHNYGLLPPFGENQVSSRFEISEQLTGKVEIKLRSCNAITGGGCRISYNPGQSNYLLYTHTFSEEKESQAKGNGFWDVILTVDPFKRIPTGIPDGEETPPRHPDTTEYYGLTIVPQGQVNKEQLGMFHLVIGRIRQNGNRYEVDTQYIPPCVNMSSHPDLLDYYERFGSYLNDIERASKIIISKTREGTRNSPLATHIGNVCEDLMRYIASIYFAYRNTGRTAAPVEIVGYFSTLAHTCFISLNFISRTQREELLKYFYEWSDVTPGSFEELLANSLNVIYEHGNIRTIMLQIESFLRVMGELWLKLSSLEYIGQHKENIVISERTNQTDAPKVKSGWTILD